MPKAVLGLATDRTSKPPARQERGLLHGEPTIGTYRSAKANRSLGRSKLGVAVL